MTYRLYRKEGFANADALNGGMSMADAAAILSGENTDISGGWAQDAPFPAGDVQEIADYTVSKYNLPPALVGSMLQEIYRYDTALIYDDSTSAYDIKQNVLNHFGPAGRAAASKLWTYLRSKVHQGMTKPVRLSSAQRAARKQAAANARLAKYKLLRPPNLNWYGSNPYVTLNGQSHRYGSYKGLMYKYNRPARIPAAARYAILGTNSPASYPAAAAAADDMEEFPKVPIKRE